MSLPEETRTTTAVVDGFPLLLSPQQTYEVSIKSLFSGPETVTFRHLHTEHHESGPRCRNPADPTPERRRGCAGGQGQVREVGARSQSRQ